MRFPSFQNKGVVVLVIFAVLISSNIFKKEIKGFFYLISSPFESLLWKQGSSVSHFFSSFFDTVHLKQEMNDLKTENLSLRARVFELQSVQRENDELKKAMGLSVQKEFKVLLAHIIGKDPHEDIIFIDKGRDAGFEVSMPVITPGKVAVGSITEVFGNASKVLLISDEKSSLDVQIPSKKIHGLLKGQGGFSALLDLVPKDKDLAQGDIVVTTRLNSAFPENLLLGKVQEIRKNDVAPFESAKVIPFFDMNDTPFLFVIPKAD